MKTHNYPNPAGIRRTFLTAALLLLPTLAYAHPGHYHPGEEDEFDALSANFLHLHGSLEIGLACVALASVAVFKMNPKRPVRIASAIAFAASLVSIAAF